MATWKLCRACLITKESFTYNLYENVSPDIYNFCTSVEIRENEDLPKGLCNSCYELLGKYTEFKQTCIQSQSTLLNLDLKSNLKKENRTFQEQIFINECDKTNKQPEIVTVKEEGFSDYNDANDFLETTDFSIDDTANEIKLKKREVKKLVKIKKKNKVKKHFNFTCEMCNKKFIYLERFEAHKLAHEGKIVPIHCLPCNKTFMTWSGLKRHNENEHTLVNLESLKCITCGKIFKNRESLKMHRKTHGERKMYVCDVCGKGFTTKFILRTHLETHKENRERQYTCEHCGKKFYTNTILLSHVSRRHTGRRFICQICNYPFTDKCNLAKHLLIHDGKKLYKCDICLKSYGTQSSLIEHKRIHSGERPFLCSYCPKGFLSKRRLNDHHRTHTGERPHKCTVCDLGFTQRGTLKRHMKVHDRVMPVIN
ncbi:zinc finger protein 624-like [Galleria mellonella]|uniref:Zinc finger protein 624-like n=1 Tax=Galleria mellonella TaxID=7137 RepID=A0A6J1WSY5_GALME|nr:zinc finger protein 624-like [Galleria mellonella]